MNGTSQWNPNRHSVSVMLRPDPGGTGRTTISVRHPTDPYPYSFVDAKLLSANNIYDLVQGYLAALTALDIKKGLGFSLATPDDVSIGATQEVTCFPLEDSESPWKTSFLFDRTRERKGEHALIVLAANALLCDDGVNSCGIRVVAHWSEERRKVYITSMSAYLPKDAKVQLKMGQSPPKAPQPPIDRKIFSIKQSREPASSGPIDGIKSRSPTGANAILKKYLDKKSEQLEVLSSPRFLEYRKSDLLHWNVNSAAHNNAVDVEDGAGEPPKDVRSDRFSEEKAYSNSQILFERLERYGIEPDSYFRSAELPLIIYYRSVMPYGPGRDGQTVNAAVQPEEWRRHQIAPNLCESPPPKLHMHFALANRSHRGRKEWNGTQPSPAEPLGIVSDPRWVWHEFGHVLLMATTGELEMRFAHSPGDALAAIAEDPESCFVEDTNNPDRDEEQKKRRWRGVTFPWVYLPRRHDRCVKRGWSWSGAMHRPLRELPDIKQPRRKAYRSEQILSTSLFRLYLCLGGMTPNDAGWRPDDDWKENAGWRRRRAASEYTLYLIIKGLGLLGDARIVPANHPDQLVSALIDADIGTARFEIDIPKRDKIGPFPGGFTHKVIRWAFEAQGLYAGSATDNNDKGAPPAVDIYIADRRPEYEDWCGGRVEHGKGSYVPVSLEGPKDPSDEPLWFTDKITVTPDKGEILVDVEVGNRGSKDAEKVTVRVFYAQWDGGDLPLWEGGDSKNWKQAEPRRQGETHTIKKAATSESQSFGPYAWEDPDDPNAKYLILAEATCEADRANTIASAQLPCSRGPIPLADLVANDNNLGLTLWLSR